MVLHVIDNLLPERGGPTSVVIELARHQALAGEKVAVICREAPWTPVAKAALAESWEGTGIEFMEAAGSSSAQRTVVRSAMERYRPTTVHLHSMWERLLRIASQEARRNRIPMVTSTHGMLHPYALNQKRWKKEAYLAVFRAHFRRSGEYLALNEEESRYITQRFGWRSSVLYNGVELDLYGHGDVDEFRKLVPALGNRPYALFIGRLHPIKGCDLLLRSFAIARAKGLALDLVLVGPDEGSMADLERDIAALGLSGHVHLTGGLFGGAKRAALAGCTVFLHRPRFEGFGIAVVEAMASSKPVVTTRHCHLEAAANAGAIVMAPDDDEGYAEALRVLVEDRSSSERFAREGRSWSERNCSWTSIARTTAAAYERSRCA